MTATASYFPPTPEQAAAIAARDRDCFCEAGAGTGKTSVLVGRYCDAVAGREAEIDEVLAFTFTERAAAELRQRIRRELGRRAREADRAGDGAEAARLRGLARETERAWVTTIHGFCRRVLGHHPVAAGLDPRFRVIDAPAAERLRAQAARDAVRALVAQGNDRVARAAAAYKPWRLQQIALIAHERLRSQGMAEPLLLDVPEPTLSGGDRPPTPEQRQAALDSHGALADVLAELGRRYGDLKLARSGLDFADLELRAVEVLRHSRAVAALWRERFKHVMVDEFQDTNRVQLDLIECLHGPDTGLFTVGDEHQSIYRFRHADLEVFRAERRAAGDSPDTDIVDLRGNFRSRPPVLAAANELGATLLDGFEPLTAGREPAPDDPPAELLMTLNEGRAADHRKWDDHAEALDMPESESSAARVAQARALAERLRALVDAGEAAPGEIVVLLRAFTHVDAYEEALRRFGLEPYVVGGRGYWSQQQVEDLLRLLAVIANPLDDEMLFGALASPANEISPDALWLLRMAAGEGHHVWPALERGFGESDGDFELAAPELLDEIDDADGAGLRRFCEVLRELRAEAPLLPLDSLVERTMNAFGYDLALLARTQAAGRMANVRKLMRLAAEFERNEGRDLRAFLDQAAEATKRDEREGMAPVQAEGYDGVRIMTVHAAKGLEFPAVAVPELDRNLDAGHNHADVWIGRPDPEGEPARFGLRLAFPTAESCGVWELTELDREEKEAEAEESCRLVYVAATRAQERLILSGTYKPQDLESADPKTNDSGLKRFLPVIAGRGWAGDPVTVDLRPPAPALEGKPAAPPGQLRIAISEPGEGRAAELARKLPPVGATVPDEDVGSPPILDPARATVPLGHLSYSALDAYKRCGYRFYVERVLGVHPGAPAAAAPANADGPPADEDEGDLPGDLVTEPDAEDVPERPPTAALALGNAVHATLEWSARNGWERPEEGRLTALLAHEGIEDEPTIRRAKQLIEGWLASELRASLAGFVLRPEAPFVLPLGGTILRGNIDLLATGEEEIAVVDFKTDRVAGATAEELRERYATQRAIYALAAAERDRPVRAAHVFLERPDEPVVEVFDAAALRAARERLEGLVAQIRSGTFEPAAEPYAALCFGCPAAPRLCPRPAWRPRREAPAALR